MKGNSFTIQFVLNGQYKSKIMKDQWKNNLNITIVCLNFREKVYEKIYLSFPQLCKMHTYSAKPEDSEVSFTSLSQQT